MYVNGPLHPPTSYMRGVVDGDYPTVPPRFYPHDCYPSNPAHVPADGKPRPSFYISDILYPSVIPLPGTLPTSTTVSAVTPSSHRPRETSPLSSAGSSPALATEVSGRLSPRSPEGRGRVRVLHPLPLRLPPVKSKDLKFGIDTILGSGQSVKSEKVNVGKVGIRNRELQLEGKDG